MSRTNWRALLTVLMFGVLGGSVEAAGTWRLLHDPLSGFVAARPTPAEKTLIDRAAKVAGIAKPQLLAQAPGPFLKRGAKETALVYRGENVQSALLIVRDGRPVLHLRLTDDVHLGSLSESYSLRDIDQDGLRELALILRYPDGSVDTSWLAFLDFAGVDAGQLPRVSSHYRTHYLSCGDGGQGKERFYRLWVQPGRTPQLRADLLGSDTCAQAKPALQRQGIQPEDISGVEGSPHLVKLPLP